MGRKKNYDRTEVLESARDLFWAKGYEGTHLQELVEVTGVNRFSLYSEFDGKEGLFLESLRLYLDEAEQSYRRMLLAKPLGVANIRAYFDGISFSRDYSGCFMINTLTERHVIAPEAFQKAKQLSLQVEKLFLKNLEAAKGDGRFEDRDLVALSKLLSVIDQGLAIYGFVSPSHKTKAALVQQLDFLLLQPDT